MNLAERIAAVQRSQSATTGSHEHVRDTVQNLLIEELGQRLHTPSLADDDLRRDVSSTVAEVVAAEAVPLTATQRSRMAQEIAADLLGHGPLEALLRDDSISEIMVNGAQRIFIERDGRLQSIPATFVDEEQLRRTIDRMVSRVGRRVDESSPMVDARLPDGSRVNVVMPPLALDGPLVTVRKFSADPIGIEDLISFETLSTDAAEFLAAAVRGRLNLLVSGSTGAGKTTTLNVLSSFIPSDERIVTIEDAAELQLQQPHVVRLESRPPNVEGRGEITIRDLVRNSLRMRPDRIIVGEVRDTAAVDMLQAMSTGHDGSICTVHASGARDALSRIETMVLLSGVDLPLRAVREHMAGAIDLIVHQERGRDGRRRICTITEVSGMESDVITLQDIFIRETPEAPLIPSGLRPRCLSRLESRGVDLSRIRLVADEDDW